MTALHPDDAAILTGLNPQQRAVVTTLDGPLLVVAGAGSGKTTTLVRRVAWMIRRGVPPASILLLTFTRAAAANMLGRARALVPEARGVTGGTFHSIGNMVIRELHDAFGLPERFTVLDPDDAEQAMRAVIAEDPYPGNGRTPKPRTVVNVLSLQANTRCGIDEAIARKGSDYQSQAEWFERVGVRYAEWKLERALLDYDDLLVWFTIALRNPDVAAHLRARWPYVLVDEHQDSNALQLDIVYGLGGDQPNVMVVGDPAQAIYGFRGSAPETLFHFKEQWPHASVLPLETNYRSTQPILDLVNAVDLAMSPRFDRVLRAASPGLAERPALVLCADDRTQAVEVCRRVLQGRDEGVELHEQAVLARSMWAVRRIEAELIAQRIPYKVVGGLRIDEAAHVKDLLSLARVADNPRNEPAWGRVIGLLPNSGAATIKKVLAHVYAAPDTVPSSARLRGAPWPRRVEAGPLYAALEALEAEAPPSARIRAAVECFEGVFRAVYEGEWNDRRRDLDTLAALADDHDTLSAFLAAVTIDYSLDGRERADVAPRPEERPLTLSTVHSSKGLEWHTVHIPLFAAGHYPSSWAVWPEEIAEELRVFYVATSRARRRLLLYRPLVSDEGWMREESPFEALIEAFLEREEPPPPPKPEADKLQGVKIDVRAALFGKR